VLPQVFSASVSCSVFATDVYLDTFLDELHQQGLTYEIPDRHPLQIAPIADYRNAKQK
jgi:hypothetical protein